MQIHIHIYIYIYNLYKTTCYLSLSLSFSKFCLRHSIIRSSISTSVIVPLLVLVLLFYQKKTQARTREATTVFQRFFLLRDFRRFISGQTRRNHGDLIACFPFFTIALFKFLRLLPYNRMPRPRLFCANDEDANAEYTVTILPKRPPSPVRFVTKYLNTIVSVLK